jgi:O2-independent ubiquinone biosynthesis protein UbiV
MEIAVQEQASELTLGPVLFNWAPERWRDFYFRIADEAAVTIVYLGEAVCFKRAPLFDDYLDAVAERLAASGKSVVRSTLAEVMSKQERSLVADVCADPTAIVEANDGSALLHLRGRPHHIGPFMNVYNERTMAVLASGGACAICLPAELPADAIAALCADAAKLGVTIEAQVFGRLALALSARCYHARAHERSKDSCQFVCNQDPDGMPLRTLDEQPFLAINGIQTMSHDYLNLIGELADLETMGVRRFRLSPHSCDMVEVAATFRAVLDRQVDTQEAAARLGALKIEAPFSNGFYHGKPGHLWN